MLASEGASALLRGARADLTRARAVGTSRTAPLGRLIGHGNTTCRHDRRRGSVADSRRAVRRLAVGPGRPGAACSAAHPRRCRAVSAALGCESHEAGCHGPTRPATGDRAFLRNRLEDSTGPCPPEARGGRMSGSDIIVPEPAVMTACRQRSHRVRPLRATICDFATGQREQLVPASTRAVHVDGLRRERGPPGRICHLGCFEPRDAATPCPTGTQCRCVS